MRQRWLTPLLVGALIFLQAGFSSADTWRSTFLILSPTVDINEATTHLEARGARISNRVPPSIIIADLPSSLSLKNLFGVKTTYQTAIPLTVLQPLGIVATASGMKWNRSFLSRAAGADTASFASMRSLVSQKSLSAPLEVNAAQDKSMVVLSWKAVASALFYEVEAASDAGFAQRVYLGHVAGLSMNIPVPEGNGPIDIFYRVRAVDHGDDDHLRLNNIFGAWSNITPLRVQPTSVSVSLQTPMPSSPLDKYQSEGFTLILAWSSIGSLRTRVEVATDHDFKNMLFDAVVTDREFACSSPAMELGDTLYWRVKAWDDQKSAWSDVRQFTIGAPAYAKTDVLMNPEAPK